MISVIVPIFNAEKYLHNCVDSILAQTYRDLEILLIDDGSMDSSSAICDKYALMDARVRVIHQSNAGGSAARHTGFATFTGDYVACIDADDSIAPRTFQTQLDVLEEQNADMVISGMQLYSGNRQIKTFEPPCCVCTAKQATELILQTPGYMNSLSNKLFRKALLYGFQGKSYAAAQDLAVTYQLVHRCARIALIPDVLYFYRIHAESTVNGEFQPKRLDSLRSFDDMAADIRRWYPDLENRLRVCETNFALALLRRVVASGKPYPQEERMLAERVRKNHRALWKTRPFPKKVWMMDIVFRMGAPVYRRVFTWYERRYAKNLSE